MDEVDRQIQECITFASDSMDKFMKLIMMWGKYKQGKDTVYYDRFHRPTSDALSQILIQVAKSFNGLKYGPPNEDTPVGILFAIKNCVDTTQQVVDYICEDKATCEEKLSDMKFEIYNIVNSRFSNSTIIIDSRGNSIASLMEKAATKIIS